MISSFSLNIYVYILLGIGLVLFVINFPNTYIKYFKRALYIIKTASFKMKMKDDPYLKNFTPAQKQEKLNKDQARYESEIDQKIIDENYKQADSPKQATWKLLLVITAWPFIAFLFLFAEFLRMTYLTQDELKDLENIDSNF